MMTYYRYYYHKLYFKDNINCSYVNRVSVKETSHVDFIYQFVNTSCTQSNDNFNTFVNSKIIEPPKKVTKYEDFKKRIYKPLDDYTSSSELVDQTAQHDMIKKCINIEFYEACYPIKLSVFARDCFNSIIRIWAQNSDNQWFLLWSIFNCYNSASMTTKSLYTPILWRCDFKTKLLKLEFDHDTINHTKIDAVMLIGTSEFILPKSPKRCLSNLLRGIRYEIYHRYFDDKNASNTTELEHLKDPHLDVLQLQENFDEYCIICKSDVVESFYKSELGRKQMGQKITVMEYFKEGYMHRFLKSYSNKKCKKDIKSSSNETKELSSCNFSALSDEIVLKILKNLDMTSLIRMSRVNKRFNNLSRDFELYKCLNLHNIYLTNMHNNICQLFNYFASRCKNLQQLDLSYSRLFASAEFRNFFKTCCRDLTHLRLSNCYVNDSELQDIFKICTNLKELDLSYCRGIIGEDMSYLKNLQCLECLHLEKISSLKATTLCEILKRNRHMRDLNLANTGLWTHEVAMELQHSCPNLEKLNLAKGILTSKSIYALADCKKLKEVNFSYCMIDYDDYDNFVNGKCFSKLFSSCQYLEKIDFNYFVSPLNGCVWKTLTSCKNLKVLNLQWQISVTPDICSQLFIKCPKLYEIDLSYCGQITESFIDQWNEIHNVIVYKYV